MTLKKKVTVRINAASSSSDSDSGSGSGSGSRCSIQATALVKVVYGKLLSLAFKVCMF